ncbi:MAG: hypothetical protein ACRC5T_04400 [Cetobacterium sp.]
MVVLCSDHLILHYSGATIDTAFKTSCFTVENYNKSSSASVRRTTERSKYTVLTEEDLRY